MCPQVFGLIEHGFEDFLCLNGRGDVEGGVRKNLTRHRNFSFSIDGLDKEVYFLFHDEIFVPLMCFRESTSVPNTSPLGKRG